VTSDAAVTAVIDTLQHLHVPFMIVGSLATNFHGVPRSTRDADFANARVYSNTRPSSRQPKTRS
jgi:hypothetical protein